MSTLVFSRGVSLRPAPPQRHGATLLSVHGQFRCILVNSLFLCSFCTLFPPSIAFCKATNTRDAAILVLSLLVGGAVSLLRKLNISKYTHSHLTHYTCFLLFCSLLSSQCFTLLQGTLWDKYILTFKKLEWIRIFKSVFSHLTLRDKLSHPRLFPRYNLQQYQRSTSRSFPSRTFHERGCIHHTHFVGSSRLMEK